MRVLGIDPGSRKMGVAVVEGDQRRIQAVAFATVKFNKPDLPGRLSQLFEQLNQWIVTYAPDHVAVEDVFVRNNARSALTLGHARGVALLALGQHDLPLTSYAPATVKKAVGGHGRAGKAEMIAMVRLQLNLDRDPSEDSADALAVAMTYIVENALQTKIGIVS